MDAVAIALVLSAAVFHAGWNLVLHRTDDRLASMAVNGLVSGVALSPFIVVSPPRGVLLVGALSAVAQSVYGAALSAAYRRGELSVTYPIGRGSAPLLVTLGGWIVLSERPSASSFSGAIALGGGLVVLALAGRAAHRGEAVRFAALVGLATASYSILDTHAVRRVPALGYLGAVMAAHGLVLAASIRFDTRRLRRAAPSGALIAVGSTLAYSLVLLAFRRAGAGHVATLREVSVLLGILLSRERPGRAVWFGSTLVVAGAVLAAI